MRYGPSADAPTHLGSNQLGLPPDWLEEGDGELVTSAVRGGRNQGAPLSYSQKAASGSIYPREEHRRESTERSAGAMFPPEEAPYRRVHTERSVSDEPAHRRIPTERSYAPPAELPSAPVRRSSRDEKRRDEKRRDEKRREKSAAERPSSRDASSREKSVAAERSSNRAPSTREKSVAAERPSSREKSVAAERPSNRDPASREKSVAAERPSNREKSVAAARASSAPTPQAPAQQAQHVPQMPPGINAIDPLSVPVPPELGAPIYGWVRRLALQADLAGADRVLRDALLDLTSSLAVTIVYPGPDGLWSLGADDEIPRDAQPLIAVAQARRAVVSSHTAIIPCVTSSETVAVVTLTRNPRNPAYHPIEQIAMIALVREAAAILHHLAVAHLQKTAEINADKGGLYRGEALEAHRSRGAEGVPVQLTPAWVKRAYPFLVGALLIAVVVSIFIKVPTYSTGQAMVQLQGTTVSSPSSGTVAVIAAKPGDRVVKGQVLMKLTAVNEEAELRHAKAEEKNLLVQRLQDNADEAAQKNLANAMARTERAQAALDARVVRAPRDGVISDGRLDPGKLVQPGDHIMTIVDTNTEPEILAFLPGKDRPRLKIGQTLQIELLGEKKTRELATITSISNEIIGPQEAARFLGAGQADAMKLQGPGFVIVKAKLPGRTFQTEQRTLHYYHGMQAVSEVRITNKPFLVTLLPALEKYIPE
jgi:hypothetical protein